MGLAHEVHAFTGASFFSLSSTCMYRVLCMDLSRSSRASLVNRHGDICGVDGGRLCRIFIALG